MANKRISTQILPGLVLPAIFCATCVVLYFNLYYKVPISRSLFPDIKPERRSEGTVASSHSAKLVNSGKRWP